MRLDLLLTARGLADSRAKAQSMIEGGAVYVNGRQATKAAQACDETDRITVEGEICPYVSRGGLKLEKALREFGICPAGWVCSDSGASTGGFTDCLLQQGAAQVFAIDVGTGQLDPKIRRDPRVVVMEQTNIRDVTPEQIGRMLDFSVVDVSFISLQLVLPVIASLLKPAGQAVCLIKPQFEAGKANLNKKGVVRDAKVHVQVLRRILALARELGFSVAALTYSPVLGPEGNIEFLMHLTKTPSAAPLPDPEAVVTLAHRMLKG